MEWVKPIKLRRKMSILVKEIEGKRRMKPQIEFEIIYKEKD